MMNFYLHPLIINILVTEYYSNLMCEYHLMNYEAPSMRMKCMIGNKNIAAKIIFGPFEFELESPCIIHSYSLF